MSRPIRAVIFDYGLVLSGPPDPSAWSTMLRLLRVEEPQLRAAYWDFRDAYDLGRLGGTTYWQAVAAQLECVLEDDSLAALLEADVTLWAQPNEPMIVLAKQLQSAGIPTAILSNLGDAMEIGLRERLPWLSDFSHLCFSHSLGIHKPDAAIYQDVLANLGIPAAEVLFVDDRAVNIAAARTVGMQAIEYSDHLAFERELTSLAFVTGSR